MLGTSPVNDSQKTSKQIHFNGVSDSIFDLIQNLLQFFIVFKNSFCLLNRVIMRLFWCNYITQLIFYHYALLRNDILFQTPKSSNKEHEIFRTAGFFSKLLGYLPIWIPLPAKFTFIAKFSLRSGRFRLSMDRLPNSLKPREIKKLFQFQSDWKFDFCRTLSAPLAINPLILKASRTCVHSKQFGEYSVFLRQLEPYISIARFHAFTPPRYIFTEAQIQA